LVVENALSRYMGERGFVVLTPPTGLIQGLRPAGEVEAVELSDDEAINLAKQEGAEVVIVGKAFAQLSGNILGTDIKSVEANVSARAIKVDDGLVIGSFDGTKAAVHSDEIAASEEALALTVSDLAEDLTRQIAANWGKVTSQSVLVELVVKGIKEYADFVRFRTTLKNEIRGVNNIYLRAIQAGEATMDVDVKGNPRTLADELILKSFEGFGVNIFEVGQTQIKLELIPKRDVLDELQTLNEEEDQP
jgi:hypothetical protein